jgi:DNA repair protein RecN (Recombination protein N)
MLSRLSIRDIVLIERLDIDCASGLSILTGETGAGKSILLDAFALALGSRGDATLVRQGAGQGQVTAAFDVEPDHPVLALLRENGISAEDGLILRRVQLADGRTRAFVSCSTPMAGSKPMRSRYRGCGPRAAPRRTR